ncbi:MAG: hypothetical protein U0694_25690 [Anaerolineae bacterium]
MANPQKPGRPFGLSLAILLSVIYFSVLPLMANGLIWKVRQQFMAMQNEAIAENLEAATGIPSNLLVGVEGLPEVNFWQVLLSLIFIPVAVLAWRGRPASMRYVMMFAIIGITVFNLVLTFSVPPPDPLTQGMDSSAEVTTVFSGFQLISNFLVVLYVVWYINRAPARAFYRGYYLPEPSEQQK